MTFHKITCERLQPLTIPLASAFILLFVAQYNFCAFHLLIEIFSIIISAIIFTLAWFTKKYAKNSFLLFIGCGYLWIGAIDLIHLLNLKWDEGIIAPSLNRSMQFSLVTVFLQVAVLFGGALAATRKYNSAILFVLLGGLTCGLSFLFIQEQFPITFVDGQGTTNFKLVSDFSLVIILLLVVRGLLFIRTNISDNDKKLVLTSVVVAICSEVILTYSSVGYSSVNVLAYILKLVSYWLILIAIVKVNLQQPYAAIEQNRQVFKRLFDNSDVSIWNVDFSAAILLLERLGGQECSDLFAYLNSNKRAKWELVKRIKVIQVNQATVELFAAKHQDDFLNRINETFTVETVDMLINCLNAIWQHNNAFRTESIATTLNGKEVNFIISFQVPSASEDYSAVPVTLVDITQRKKSEARIWRQGNFDSLTGLVNRNLFSDRLAHALDCAKRNRDQLALLYLDLDGFKHVNDTQGHLVGDQLLQETARRLLAHMRESDTVARLGGDEFAIILPTIQCIHDIEVTVAKIQSNLEQPYYLQGHVSFVSASIGITVFPCDGDDTVALLRKADSAMYKAKQKGRNNYQFFTDEIEHEAMRRKELEEALHIALAHGEFVLNYQPVISMKTGRIASAEALIRWQHPEKGVIQPSEFIPLAEEIGLILPIGEWVLREACQEALTWENSNNNLPAIAVNVSSCQFQRQDIAQLIESILLETGLPGNRLIIEITESLLLADNDKILGQLQAIRALGVGFSIDDFGTGYSSLSYLKKFPVNTLKIDRSFITNLPTAAEDVALVNAILSMADSLGINVVAEGIETQLQADFISLTNCRYLQGYFYSKPLTKDDFISFCAEHRCCQQKTALGESTQADPAVVMV